MGIKIAIIGGTGGIGRWFADFLSRDGYSVQVVGRSEKPDPLRLAATSDVVIISVPMAATEETIARIGPHLKKNALFMDLTSVKDAPVAAMLTASCSEVIGCHPLFGPTAVTIAGQNVIICPARGERWLAWWKKLLADRGALITEMEPGEHDRLMAIIQGLNHLNTLAMGMVLRKKNIVLPQLQHLTTPLFNAKTTILERLLTGNAALYADLMTQNRYLGELVDLYEAALRELKVKIAARDREGLAAILADSKRIL